MIAASLIVPQLGTLVERPFRRLARAPAGDLGGGFLLGASLGLVFVPCADPVLAAVTVQAATLDFGWRTIALTFAYALGAAVPMLLVAAGGQRFLRPRAPRLRAVLGALVALATLAIVFDVDRRLQTALGDYTNALQKPVERSSFATRELNRLTGAGEGAARAAATPSADSKLPDFGPAPNFAGIGLWLNTSGGKELTMQGLRGKVVLIDFWTYSCINCLRTLPYVEAWDRAYRRDGLVVIGVHTPEFAFEHVPSNVGTAVKNLGVEYPVVLNNRYGTWLNWGNQYWPAKYLVDWRGHVRFAHFGEGAYAETEQRIRELLGERRGLPKPSALPDRTPTGLATPESYLGYKRIARYAGSKLRPGRMASYELPASMGQDEFAHGGRWRLEAERIVAGKGAILRLRYRAHNVLLVLGGAGAVRVLVDGKPVRTVRVSEDRLYPLVQASRIREALLELRFTPDLAAYAFTFG